MSLGDDCSYISEKADSEESAFSYNGHTKGCDETPNRQDLSARCPL
jgi:hypothetical protein